MSLARLLARCAETAVKLPVAAAWDVISLGNMGEGSSTARVLAEHRDRTTEDQAMDCLEMIVDAVEKAERVRGRD